MHSDTAGQRDIKMASLEFNHRYVEIEEDNTNIADRVKHNCYCSHRRAWKFWSYLFPIIKFLKYYHIRDYIFTDILTGITIGIMHIPQALAFGLLTSVKVENGLYTSLWPVLLYVVFGTSPHVSMGTSAVICMVVAGAVDGQAEWFKSENNHLLNTLTSGNVSQIYNNETLNWEDVPEFMDFKENVAMNISLFSGLILIFMGFFRLGFITAYFSDSFFSGFTSGAAVHVATSQMPALLGINVKRYSGPFKIVYTYIDIVKKISNVTVATIIISIVCIIILYLVKTYINERFKSKLKIPVPIELIIVIVATIASYFANLQIEYGVAVVGPIPNRIPPPILPDMSRVGHYFVDCFVVAILIFANTIAMAKICAKKHNYELNDNQEITAYGLCNFVSSFFKCFPSAVAPPRSMIASSLNSKTTLNGIFAATLMFLVIVAISELFYSLPRAALAAIIFVALKGLFIQMKDGRKFWRINKYDFVIWLFTLVSVVFIDIDIGLGVGLGISLLSIVFQSQRAPAMRLMKYSSDMKNNNNSSNKQYSRSPIKIFIFRANIFFANTEIFRNKLYSATVNPRKYTKLLNKEKEIHDRQRKTRENEFELDEERKTEKKISTITKDSFLSGAPSTEKITPECEAESKVGYDNILSMYQSDTTEPVYNMRPATFICIPPPKHVLSLSSLETLDSLDTVDSGFEEVTKPGQLLSEYKRTRCIIVDMTCVNYIDASGCNVLTHIYKEYEKLGIKLLFASCSHYVFRTLYVFKAFEVISEDRVFLDLADAVLFAERDSLGASDVIPITQACTDEEAAEDSYAIRL